MPKQKKYKRTFPKNFWSWGRSDDREFLVGLLILIFIGVAAVGGYAGKSTLTGFLNKPTGPTGDFSNEKVVASIALAKGVNWTVWTKWKTKDGYNWQGIESDLLDMQGAGITWVRTLSANTDNDTDKLLILLKNYKITPLVILSGNPLKSKGTFIHRIFYKNALKSFITRYKDKIKYFEVWNEPNNPQFWDIPDIDIPTTSNQSYEAAVTDYTERLQDTYTTIKTVSPQAYILLGGLSTKHIDLWIDIFSQNKGYEYIDGVSFHPSASTPEEINTQAYNLKVAMSKVPEFGVKAIWITEFGFTTDAHDTSVRHVLDEKTKAEYMARTINLLRGSGFILPLFWSSLSEIESNKPGAGLIMKNNETLKTTYLPAYDIIKQL